MLKTEFAKIQEIATRTQENVPGPWILGAHGVTINGRNVWDFEPAFEYIALMDPPTTLILVDRLLEFERIASQEQALRLQYQDNIESCVHDE